VQEREIERLGGGEPIPVDVRLIAATNHDLRAAMDSGRFREDLYYRLAVMVIELPRLVDRGDDLLLLAAYFINSIGERYGKRIAARSHRVLDVLRGRPWTGNVRELRNVIEQAVLLARGHELSPSLLPQMMHREPAPAEVLQLAIGTPMDAIEREVILRTLEANHGNKTATAEVLGISRRSIYNKLAEYEAQGHLPRSATTH